MSAGRRLATLGVAMGGVLTAHWLTYATVAPSATARATILHKTGHAYLGFANELALVVALAALAALFVGQLSSPTAPARATGVTRRVVLFQVGAFVIMEVLERVTAGAPLSELIHTGVLPIGIAAQVAVGLVAAVAIRWLLHVADRVAAALAQAAAPARRDVARQPLPVPAFVPRDRHLSAVGLRGPPLPV